MNRSLYPEGVEIHQVDLVRETQATIDAIATRYTSTNSMGVLTGLAVAPASINTLLSVTSGTGYSPNGELVVVPVSQTNIALANSAPGAVNYVLAVYTETYGSPQAHEDLGTTLATAATGSSRIVVLTAAQWSVLPVTDPNLNNNSRDRAVILAIVTGTGGVLTQNNIQSPIPYPPIYHVTQPTTISGVRIDGVSTNTQIGTGTLTYTIMAGVRRLQWTAPGDAIGPASIDLTINQTLVLLSSNPIYTATVTVTFVDLPVFPALIANGITTSEIYAQDVPRLSGIDNSHRHMLGHGVPSIYNPHGTTLADIDVDISGVIQQHQVEMHANGILDPTGFGGSSPYGNTTSLRTEVLSASGMDDMAHVTALNPMLSTGHVVYVNGLRLSDVAAQDVSFADVDANHIGLYGIYLQPNGTVYKTLRGQLSPLPSTGMWPGPVPPAVSPDPFQGNIQPINISDYSNTFDTLQDVTIAFRNLGVAQMAIVPTLPGLATFWVNINALGPSSIARLPYPSPTAVPPETLPPRSPHDYIDVWINPAWILVASGTPSVIFRIYERPPAETSFLLSYVVSQGKPYVNSPATVMLGWGLWGSLSTLRTTHTFDRRLFGTLAGLDINDATIGKEKIKDLSQSQVFDAIGYMPAAYHTDPVATLANSWVQRADYALTSGSSTTTTWASLTGVPSLLWAMTGGNTFNSTAFFNGTVSFANTVSFGAFTSFGVGSNTIFQAGSTTTFQAPVTFNAAVTVNSSLVANSLTSNGTVTIADNQWLRWGSGAILRWSTGTNLLEVNTNVSMFGTIDMGASGFKLKILNVETCTNPFDAANKHYVDSVNVYGIAAVSFYTGVPPTVLSYVPYAASPFNSVVCLVNDAPRGVNVFELPPHPTGRIVTIVSAVANAMTDTNNLQTSLGPAYFGRNLPNPHSWPGGYAWLQDPRRIGFRGWYSSTDGDPQQACITFMVYYIITDSPAPY